MIHLRLKKIKFCLFHSTIHVVPELFVLVGISVSKGLLSPRDEGLKFWSDPWLVSAVDLYLHFR